MDPNQKLRDWHAFGRKLSSNGHKTHEIDNWNMKKVGVSKQYLKRINSKLARERVGGQNLLHIVRNRVNWIKVTKITETHQIHNNQCQQHWNV